MTTVGERKTAKNFRTFIERDQANGADLELLRYAKTENPDDSLLLPPNIDMMAVSTSLSTNVIDASDPLFPIAVGVARRFSPDDPCRPQMLVETAEEWAGYNYSLTVWADMRAMVRGAYGLHYPGLPLRRGDGQARFAAQPEDGNTWQIPALAVDHSFHIHTNPTWVMRIEVPDEQATLVNILDKPEWRDVVWVPRNGGTDCIPLPLP